MNPGRADEAPGRENRAVTARHCTPVPARGRRLLRAAAGAVLLLALVAAAPACGALRAAALLEDALGPSAALVGEVSEWDLALPRGEERLTLRLSAPAGTEGPWPAVLLVHGAAEGGADDARMVSLARALAARGALAASLDLPSLRAFRVDPEDPARIAAAARGIAERADLAEEGRVSLAGISIGGTYALLASGDPALEGRVPAVLAFGGYADLEALLERWMTEPGDAAPGLLDPTGEGRRRVLLAHLDRLLPDAERALAERALREADAAPPPSDASEALRLVLRVASSRDPLPRGDARILLAPLRDDAAALHGTRAAPHAGTEVFLLHASEDPVVPAQETLALARLLAQRGTEADVHVTDLFEHVGTAGGETPSFFRAWPLLRFVARFLAAAGI